MKILDYFSNDFETTEDHYIPSLKTRYYRARNEEAYEKIKQVIALEKGRIKSESANYHEIFFETPKYSAVIIYISPRINETAIDIKVTTFRMFGLMGPGKKIIEKIYQELDKVLPYKGTSLYK
ncbi:MAG: hypothetical protein PHT83_01430 [Bacilli bacterium]|nr:hypothetical protein [Bacilli bacterium]